MPIGNLNIQLHKSHYISKTIGLSRKRYRHKMSRISSFIFIVRAIFHVFHAGNKISVGKVNFRYIYRASRSKKHKSTN